ncbi:MAG: FHA domain-containing protein [Polyangiales bacterium]|nr:FHA domain-containing protein [Myxococcales bacterium]MCB9658260.1 FHA domain-containing protein [Sandaracinaceae bacterium]
MDAIQRLEWYRDWLERRGREAFRAEFTVPVLVARENLETETEASFHTAFMSRTQFLAELQKAGAAGADDRPQIRAGEVRFVQKAKGAAFADRVGVGRARNADVWLPNPRVSKYHAYFQGAADGGYTLTDAESRNGTWVDGTKLTPRKPVALADGSEVVFGPHRFTFYTPAGFCENIARRAR